MSKVIYTKYSNERGRHFSVCTQMIQEEDGSRVVIKKPSFPEAKAYVDHIYEVSRKLEALYANTDVEVNRCTKTQEGISLEYLEGRTLEEILDELLAAGENEKAKQLFCGYLDQIEKLYGSEPFCETEAFTGFFPGAEIPEGALAAPIANLDLIVQNLLICDEKKYLLDYEWTVDFPVPVTFLLYRVIFYFLHEHETRTVVREWNLYEKYGIDSRQQEIYAQMEHQFQHHILQEYTPIRELFDAVSPGIVPLSEMKRMNAAGNAEKNLQIFQKETPYFTQGDSEILPGAQEGRYEGRILLAETARYLRIDPCSCCCRIENLKLTWKSGKTAEYTAVGGIRAGKHDWIFPNEDPQFLIACDGVERELQLSFEIEYLGPQMRDLLHGVYESQQKQQQRLAHLEEKFHRIKQTKLWKAYEIYKKICR